MVLRHGLSLAAIGIGIGLAGAFALSRLIEGLLYGVRPHDPLTFVVVPALLMVVTLLASIVPAWRATRVPLTIALRAQ